MLTDTGGAVFEQEITTDLRSSAQFLAVHEQWGHGGGGRLRLAMLHKSREGFIS